MASQDRKAFSEAESLRSDIASFSGGLCPAVSVHLCLVVLWKKLMIGSRTYLSLYDLK